MPSNSTIGNTAGKLTINPIELVISADTAETITLTEGVTATPANAKFTLYQKGDPSPFSPTVLSLSGQKLFVDGAAMLDGIVNAGRTPTDYVSADLSGTGGVKFVVGSSGPGFVGTKKLGYGLESISFQVGSYGRLYVAGVNANNVLAEVSVDIVAGGGALKSTGDIAFTLKEASAPKTVNVSSDQELSVVEFWVVSDDAGTLRKIASGEVVKSLTFTFDDVAANAVDFVAAFDERYDGVSHDVAVVASSDKGRTTFTVKVNDPGDIPTPTPGEHGYNVYSNTDAVSRDLAAKDIHVIDEAAFNSVRDTFAHSAYTEAAFAADPNAGAIGGSLIVSLDVSGGKNAVPTTYVDSLRELTAAASSADLLPRSFDIRYAYVDLANPTSRDADILIGDNSVLGLSWKEAISVGVATVNGAEITVNYIVVDGDRKPAERLGKYLIIYDGRANGHIYDPMYVVTRESRGHSSGCGMGFGAFALLGLAGAAALLRRKG